MLELHIVVRVVHILAGAAWVGGSIMYLVVVMPALHIAGPAPEVGKQIALLYRRMVSLCMGVLLLSGVYLTFDRLTQTTLGLSYMVVLSLKIIAALSMFLLAIYLAQSNVRRLAKHTTRFSRIAPQLMLALGVGVFVLGALLNALFEAAIATR